MVLSRKPSTRSAFPNLNVRMATDQAQQTLRLISPLYSKTSPLDKLHAYILLPDAVALSSPDEVFSFDTTLTVFTETKKLELTAKFRRDADACRDAVRRTVAPPVWAYAVLLALAMLLWHALSH